LRSEKIKKKSRNTTGKAWANKEHKNRKPMAKEEARTKEHGEAAPQKTIYTTEQKKKIHRKSKKKEKKVVQRRQGGKNENTGQRGQPSEIK